MYHHMTKDQYAQKLKNNQLFSEKIWRQKVRGSHLWNMDHENHVEFMEIQVMAVSPNPRDDYLGIRGLPERPEIDIYAQGNYILRNGIPSDVSNTAYDKILKKGQPTTFDITYQLNGKNYPTIMERTFLKENELFRSIIKDITENESQNTRTSTEEGEKYPSKITHTSNGVEYVVHEPNLLCKESQDHFERNWDLILREKEWFKNQH